MCRGLGEVLTIDKIYVKDEFQQQVIGSKMLKFIDKMYDVQKAITLLVNDENSSAKKLYYKKDLKKLSIYK